MYGLHGAASWGCKAGASLWIEAWFGDCVYSSWELVSFYLGLSSLGFWLVAQVPQFVSNWRLQSADALSPWFLFLWLGGDLFNLLGCLLTGDQLVTQNLTATYFMFADFVIISQYMYYQKPVDQKEELLGLKDGDVEQSREVGAGVVCIPSDGDRCSVDIDNDGEQQGKGPWQQHWANYQRGEGAPLLFNRECDDKNSACGNLNATPRASPSPSITKELRRVIMQYGLEYGPPAGPPLRTNRRHGKQVRRAAVAAVVSLVGLVCLGSAGLGAASGNQSAVNAVGLAAGRKLLSFCKDPRTPWMKDFGTTVGWASASLYLGSRVSQLFKNSDRGSAEGLSLAMVFCAMAANSTYGFSILMRLSSWQSFTAKAPWLVGSLGTVALDTTILLHACYLTRCSRSRKDKLSEYTPLLV